MGVGAHHVLVAGPLDPVVIVVAATAGRDHATKALDALAQVGAAGMVLVAHDGVAGQGRFQHHVVDEAVCRGAGTPRFHIENAEAFHQLVAPQPLAA